MLQSPIAENTRAAHAWPVRVMHLASALHPQTILALDFEQRPLTPEWGAPVRLRISVKLGFKSAKNLQSITVTNTFPSGFWEKQGYNWYSGV